MTSCSYLERCGHSSGIGSPDCNALHSPILLGRTSSFQSLSSKQVLAGGCIGEPQACHSPMSSVCCDDSLQTLAPPRQGKLQGLSNNLLGQVARFLKPRSICRSRASCCRLNDALQSPLGVAELRAKLQDCRPIVREMSVKPLIALAHRGCRDAMALAHVLHRDEEQNHLLRTWVLDSLPELTEPGEHWAVPGIIEKGGPLTSDNIYVRIKAAHILGKIAHGHSGAIEALTRALEAENLSSHARGAMVFSRAKITQR